MSRSRRIFPALVFAILASGGMMAIALNGSAAAESARPLRWLFSPPGVAALATHDETSRLLHGTRPFVITTARNRFAVPPRWDAIPIVSLKSFGEIRAALAEGALGPGVKGILYDLEKWRFTPEEEQRDPARFEKMAAELVHARGLLFATAPAVDLVGVLAPAERKRRYDAYLRLGLAADAARYADVIDLQGQSTEADTGRYARFITAAAAQARQANPKVTVLAGLSTNPNGQQVTADDILRAIDATRGAVDGYWFNIPAPGIHCPNCKDFRPDIAIEVLRRLAGR